MKSIDKILDLIDKGDPIQILAEEGMVDNFNELLKYQFIDIVDDRVILTHKGVKTRALRFETVRAEMEVQD